MKYEIEIDEDMLKGHTPVAFRNPVCGEFYFDSGNLLIKEARENICFPKIIVKPPREMKFRFCGYVKNNSVQAEKYYMYNGYLTHSGNYNNYVKNGLEIWEKIDE